MHKLLSNIVLIAVISFAEDSVSPVLPKAVLTLQSGWTEIFTTERATLRCDLQGGSSHWGYKWYRDEHEIGGNRAGDTYTISSAAQRDTGSYRCRGQYQNRVASTVSNHVQLTVLALPKAVLTLQSGWTEMFPTERATLRCDLQGGSSHWGYKWYRDEHEIGGNRAGDTYTIPSAAQRDTGRYSCRGQYKIRTVLSDKSNDVSLKVLGHTPNIVVKKHPPDGEIYTGESVTLSCSVEGSSTGWQFLWYKDTLEAGVSNTDSGRIDGSSYTIRSAAPSHSGQYRCQVGRGRDPFYTQFRTFLNLAITDLPQAVLTLQSGWTEMFPTERATLRCELQGGFSHWDYKWYKDGHELVGNGAGDTYTILSAAWSDTGSYSCGGRYRRRKVLTYKSNDESLRVLENIPKAQVNQYPSHEEVYIGESVTLSCGVEGSSTGWQFLWYKDTLEAVVSNTDSGRTDGSNYTISSAAPSHSGQYWCRAGRGTWLFYTNYSDCLMLNVSVRPKATVNLETEWTEIFTTDHLTLRCEVPESSAEWNYTWYRDGQQLPENHNGERLTVTSGTGLYTCRGNSDMKPFYTLTSEDLNVNKMLQKRKMLVAIAGCLTLGPVLVILVFLSLIGRSSTAQKEELFSMDRMNPEETIVTYEDISEAEHPYIRGGRGMDAAVGQLSLYSVVKIKHHSNGQEAYDTTYSYPHNISSLRGEEPCDPTYSFPENIYSQKGEETSESIYSFPENIYSLRGPEAGGPAYSLTEKFWSLRGPK